MSNLSISVSVSYNYKRKNRDWHYRTHNTDLLNLDENKFDYKKNYLWKNWFSEILQSDVCTKWEKSRERKKLEQTKSQCKKKNKRKSRDNCTAHFSIAANAMNSVSDSGDFQDVESNYSGRLSHVSSLPAMIPSSRSVPSRGERLPPFTWNQSGLQEKVFGNQFSTFDSFRDHPQRIQSDDVQRNREAVPEAGRTMKTDKIKAQFQCRHFPTRPWTTSSTIPVDLPQNYMIGQQRQQISELHFDKFTNPQSFFLCGKFDSKIKWLLVLLFHRIPCCGSRKWR